MDKDIYRAVPFRFVVDETKADVCKLEQLTNLFPEMKEIIALGISLKILDKIIFFLLIQNHSNLII
jgi:hypothetical protein